MAPVSGMSSRPWLAALILGAATWLPAWGEEPAPPDQFPLEVHDKPYRKLNPRRSPVPLVLAVVALVVLALLWARNRGRRSEGPAITAPPAAAAGPVLHAPAPWLTRFDGDWAAEWTAATAPVAAGTTAIQSLGAIRPCLQASPFFLVEPYGPAPEDAGTVLAGCLAWGGGVRLTFSRRVGDPNMLRVLCGHQPVGYVLDPGEVFRTPRMIWAWSAEGARPLTHRLHRWVRSHAVRDG